MKHCVLCKVDFDETNAEEAAKHAHKPAEQAPQPQQEEAGQAEADTATGEQKQQ